MEFVVFTAHRFVGIDFIQVAWCRGEDLDELRGYDADTTFTVNMVSVRISFEGFAACTFYL